MDKLLFLLASLVLLGAATSEPDHESARFARCEGSGRITCVVDGDTVWYQSVKIRIADINAPELSHPGCRYEAALAERATKRLTVLLNAGPFSLQREGRDEDRYGRKLRVITRDGSSLGEQLVREGLAEQWHGRRSNWCAAA